ncbi:AAA family ATPase [Hymenobacter aquaticus]|nr:ATP-binding protein [Hymenobacter aquaticus]
MLHKIKIQRFKKFKDIEVELAPFTILMGENSSGKTTVMQAINLSLNTLFKNEFVSNDANGNIKVKKRGVGMTNLPGISFSDYRELFYAKLSRGENTQRNTKSINQGAAIELTDENKNIYKLKIRALFGTFNLKCVSTASELKNNPNLHNKAPLFISGFIGLRASEERVFPLAIQDRMRTGDVSTIIRNLVLDTKQNTPDAYQKLATRLKNDFNFELEKVEFNEREDLNILAHYTEQCDKEKLSLDFMSSGSGFMQILQILTPIYRFCPIDCDIVLLDEPDAHLHPNLQTSLAKTLRDIQKELGIQIIISTHSTSIIRASEPTEVIPVSSLNKINKALANSEDVENEIAGRIDSYDLGKSVISGQLLFLEDANTSILEAFDKIASIGSLTGANTIPILKGRGKDDKSPFFLNDIFNKFLDKDINITFIRDRDGLSDEWSSNLINFGHRKNVNLYVLKRYEIENYLLNPKLLFRAINKKKEIIHLTSIEAIKDKILSLLKETITLRKYNFEGTLEENIYKSAQLMGKQEYRNPELARSEAKKICELYEADGTFESLIINGMGKETMKGIMHWINNDLKVQISYAEILASLELEDIPSEIVEMLSSLRSKEQK